MSSEPTQDFSLLVLCSPSGAGKTTLARRLQQQDPGLAFSVSHTTRAARAQEQDGRDYHFVSAARFREGIEAGEFAEWAEVHGNFYGTSKSEIARWRTQGASGLIFDIDVQGHRQLRALYPLDTVSVFVLPPSAEELERRLAGRGSEDPETLKLRLSNAVEELSHYAAFDYLLVNEDIDASADALRAVLRTESLRRTRHAPRAERLVRGLQEALRSSSS